MKNKIPLLFLSTKAIFVSLLLIGLNFSGWIYAEGVKKERANILVEVDPRTIALPGNSEIVRVPISAARIRSTELRELNKKYNAVEIEKLFEVRQKEKKGKEKITVNENTLVAKEAQGKKGKIDLNNIVTAEAARKLKKEKDREGEGLETVEKADVYLIIFEFNPETGIDMNTVVSDYKALPVIKNAEFVIKK